MIDSLGTENSLLGTKSDLGLSCQVTIRDAEDELHRTALFDPDFMPAVPHPVAEWRPQRSTMPEPPLEGTLEKRVGELETEMADLEEYMYEWHESAETYLRALRRVVEEKLGVSLQSYLEAGEEDIAEGASAEAQ